MCVASHQICPLYAILFVRGIFNLPPNGAWFMPQHPCPDPGPDNEEPDRSPLPPAAEGDGPGEQGLYLCLPAEQLTLAGFAQNGEADTMAPGPLLATIVDTIAGPDGQGLAGCSDDQLMGIISAARRLESRAAWTLMAATAEFARRAGT